jgi:hypothetical protein
MSAPRPWTLTEIVIGANTTTSQGTAAAAASRSSRVAGQRAMRWRAGARSTATSVPTHSAQRTSATAAIAAQATGGSWGMAQWPADGALGEAALGPTSSIVAIVSPSRIPSTTSIPATTSANTV